ncbi:uncharacterized protein J4E79_001569 [Alternaria viburni]|uniref:uncharacterized protein n=1 Tax=Alternaria viburni TaxID=566460 RepID=UPI0020C54C78|nr:uncharacterized protein J4E79_001569 [Alternaria viburni]KAI4669525.1 hypothetical protein J4E79_001569 [Alternaria viburni]
MLGSKLSSPEAIQHELRDLESWALDTGLLSQGKYSLEYRLMYTKGNKACEDVCQKLRKIEAMLQEMVPLITGERIPGEDQELSDSDTDSHSNSATELQQYVNSLASRNEDLKGVTDAYGLGSCTKPVSSPDDTPAYGQSRYTDPVTDEPVIMKGLEDLEIGTEEGTASI